MTEHRTVSSGETQAKRLEQVSDEVAKLLREPKVARNDAARRVVARFFYGGNIAGAVVGSLLAGFYLLRVLRHRGRDLCRGRAEPRSSPRSAASLAKRTPVIAAVGRRQPDVERAPGAGAVYVAIALSGMTALAAEVIWTRILSLLFGATIYTFSLILAVFLVGLGIGSSLGSALARGLTRPRVALGWCQLLLCAAIAWTAHVLTQSLPYWPINPSISTDPWFTMQLDLVRCLWAVLPARDSLGRELSAGAGVGRDARTGSGAAGRRRLRRQHRRRDRRRADRQPAARGVDRQPARAAGADHRQRRCCWRCSCWRRGRRCDRTSR